MRLRTSSCRPPPSTSRSRTKYFYYYNGRQCIEARNGSGQVLTQAVWGVQYVDELVQVAWNQDPMNASFGVTLENHCERMLWVLQDANYNVLGLVSPGGRLVERYEYTPYGQRKVFSHGYVLEDLNGDGVVSFTDYFILDMERLFGGSASTVADLNGDGVVDASDTAVLDAAYLSGKRLPLHDPLVSYPLARSSRAPLVWGLLSPAGLCGFGHQGLLHDEESGLVYNRARMLSPGLGRFVQRDPLGYVDGMSVYEYVRSAPSHLTDANGLQATQPAAPRGLASGVGCPTGWTIEDSPTGSEPVVGKTSFRHFADRIHNHYLWWRIVLRYQWERVPNVFPLQSPCGSRTGLMYNIGFTADESQTVQLQLGILGNVPGLGELVEGSIIGAYSYTWSSGSNAGMDLGPYWGRSDGKCYEFLGIPLVLTVTVWSEIVRKPVGDELVEEDWEKAERWDGKHPANWRGGKKKIYVRGSYLVCKRECQPAG